MTADRKGSDDDALEQGVRISFHDVAILESSRFALIRVDHEILWLGRLFRNERPLPAGWKSRSTEAPQFGFDDLVDNLLRSHGAQNLLGRRVSAVSNVVFEPRAVYILETLREDGPVRANVGFRLRRQILFAGVRKRIVDKRIDGF